MTPENDRKEIGKALAESAGLYRLLAENSTDMISGAQKVGYESS